MLSEDLDVFFNDFAVTVVIGSVTGKGILDAPTHMISDGTILSNDYILTVRTSVFGAPLYGTSIKAGGISYTVRESRQIDDAAFTEILLSKV